MKRHCPAVGYYASRGIAFHSRCLILLLRSSVVGGFYRRRRSIVLPLGRLLRRRQHFQLHALHGAKHLVRLLRPSIIIGTIVAVVRPPLWSPPVWTRQLPQQRLAGTRDAAGTGGGRRDLFPAIVPSVVFAVLFFAIVLFVFDILLLPPDPPSHNHLLLGGVVAPPQEQPPDVRQGARVGTALERAPSVILLGVLELLR